jgi:hypothetical protein
VEWATPIEMVRRRVMVDFEVVGEVDYDIGG